MTPEELAAKVDSMKAADVLRLAAGLIDRGDTEMAEILVDRVSMALRLFGKTAKPAVRGEK